MTPLSLRRMILEVGSAVQDGAVVDELEVARLEHHLQHDVGMVGDGHKRAERRFLFRADGRVAVLHGAAHITMLEVAVEPAVFVSEARDVADQGRPAHALGVGLRTAQDEALVEFPEQIGHQSSSMLWTVWALAIRLSPPDTAIFRLSMATMPTSPLGSVCAVWKPPD